MGLPERSTIMFKSKVSELLITVHDRDMKAKSACLFIISRIAHRTANEFFVSGS